MRSEDNVLLVLLVYLVLFSIACLIGGFLFHIGWRLAE